MMVEIPYEEWADWIIKVLSELVVNNGIVTDLGCGTGSLTRLLANANFDMIGIDISEDMLGIARQTDKYTNILYIEQDICEFELYGTVAAIVSVCDTLNYIGEISELEHVFQLVNNYLDPK